MRENVDELLEQHRGSIDELRRRTADVLPADDFYDEIFLLRFVLTHSKKGPFAADDAEDAVRKTVLFRTENAAELEAVAAGKLFLAEIISKYLPFGIAGEIDGMEPVYAIRIGHFHPKALLQVVSPEQCVHAVLLNREAFYRKCDERTRRTRKMVRLIYVYDMGGATLANYDKNFAGALKRASALSAIYYPQLLGKTVVINSPSALILKAMKLLLYAMPSIKEKFGACPVSNAETCGKTASECPFLASLGGGAQSVPPFLGGCSPCPASLQGRAERADGMQRLTVPARSSKTVELDILIPGVQVEWELLIEEHGISMSMDFVQDTSEGGLIEDDQNQPIWGSAQEVLPPAKYKADDKLQTGTVPLPSGQKGMLKVTFDNTYSVLRSKTIEFRFKTAT